MSSRSPVSPGDVASDTATVGKPARAETAGRLGAFTRRRRADLAAVTGVALGALLGAAVVLRVWRGSLADAWDYQGDALFFTMLFKGITQFGWHLNNPNLGAPFGQQLYDVPALPLEWASYLVLQTIALFTSDPAAVMNVFYLLTFPLTGIACFLVLRALRLSTGAAVVCSLLFALLPYHFVRAEPHVFLSAYLTVPVSCYLALQILRNEPLWARRPGRAGRSPLAWASRRTLATLALCVLVGSSGGYYIAFTIALLAVATVVGALAHRRAVLATGAVATAVVSLTLAVAFSPSLLYALQHGRNSETSRAASVTDELGLRPGLLLLPVREHRVELVDDVREQVDDTDSTETGSTSLGIVGAIGFLALLLGALARAVRRGRDEGDGGDGGDDRFGAAAAATVTLLLLATAGGFVALARFFVASELRAWNRVSVFIAFFALFAVGLLLDRLRRHPVFADRAPAVWAAALGLVLVIGVLDQTNASFVPKYERIAAVEASDKAFVGSIERELPAGSSVFQFPYVPFFEGGNLAGGDQYDLLRPYINSNHLRWSYGAVKGRPRDWFAQMKTLPVDYVLPAVAAAGFDGFVVHRRHFGDRGRGVEGRLCGLLGEAPVRSPNGAMSFFDLRPYVDRLKREKGAERVAALGAVTVRPVELRFGKGFNDVEENLPSRWAWMKSRTAHLDLFNPADGPRAVRISGSISRASTPADVRITLPDGSNESLAIIPGAAKGFYRDLTLPAGHNYVTLRTQDNPDKGALGDARTLYLRVNDPVVVDTALLGFVRPPKQRAACASV